MLTRQRAILALLAEADGLATHLVATKWAFLLREETPSRGGPAYFQFLPYKHGPFSFCMYQETAAMTREGFVREVNDRTWALTPKGMKAAGDLDASIRNDARAVVRRFAGKRAGALISYVYDRYKWFTVNSVSDARMRKPVAAPAVYTVGYEGLTVDGFLNGLLQAGITLLVDVRHNPVSRRYGFHASTLRRLCDYVGIDYRHFPELGIHPSQRRHLVSPDDRRILFDDYERSTIPAHTEAIAQIGELLRKRPGALVCMEAVHSCCHRSRLAEAVREVSGLEVQHLGFTR
jgi:uncharacterized protein (DUF488 family)